MKFTTLLTTAVTALTLGSAAPVVEDVSVSAPLAPRNFGFGGLFGGSYWLGGRQYKLRSHCPDHPDMHQKYMNQRGDGTIGFEGSIDFQFTLDNGCWNGQSWGGHPHNNPGQDMCLTGNPGWKDLTCHDGGDRSHWPKPPKNSPAPGGYGAPPSQWGSYGGWNIDPFFPWLEIFDIFGIFSNKHFFHYGWDQNQDSNGYDWVCYKDVSGWKVKYWDHQAPFDVSIKVWFVLKIEIVKQSWWNKYW